MRLFGRSNEVDVLAYRLTVVGSDEAAVLAEFYLPTNEGGRGDFIQVGLLRRTRVRHCNRRGFCGSNSLVREPFDFVLWLLRGRRLRNHLSSCG